MCGACARAYIYIYIYIFFISLTKDFLNRVTQTWDEQYNKEDNNQEEKKCSASIT